MTRKRRFHCRGLRHSRCHSAHNRAIRRCSYETLLAPRRHRRNVDVSLALRQAVASEVDGDGGRIECDVRIGRCTLNHVAFVENQNLQSILHGLTRERRLK